MAPNLAVSAAPSSLPAPEFPVVGGYGFDKLKPETTKCRQIAKTDAFKTCKFQSAEGVIGFSGSYHACVASARSAYLVYKSRAACTEALETMRANGP